MPEGLLLAVRLHGLGALLRGLMLLPDALRLHATRRGRRARKTLQRGAASARPRCWATRASC
ncbi:MAG: hypothetical protein MZV64_43475 [Ignavibacteriales bacterium]|nr:hypothetical protein [Ignavibacteriales bacterium]